jgi:tetratricopeptide (TPR) repeat protein
VRLPLAFLAAIAALLGPRPAAAGPPIVIEAFTGDRPADADAWLAPVRAELERRGFQVGPPLTAAVAALSRDVRPLSAGDALAAKSDVDRAYNHLIEGEYAEAIAAGERALALYEDATAALAGEPAMRDLQFRALVVVARAQDALGRPDDAVRSMAEAIRTFPDRAVSASEFDPRVRDLQRRVRQELQRQGTGGLELRVDDPAAILFLNERFVGTGATRLDGLPAGTYRVHVAKGSRVGRQHRIAVHPGSVVSLAVAWELDAALRTGSAGAFLALDAGTAPDRELALAGRLARSLGAPRVVVLAVRPVAGRRAIVGYTVVTDTQTRTFGAIQLEPVDPAPAALTTLGAFLAGARGVDTSQLVLREPGLTRPARAAAPWHRDRWGWALAGGGAALLAASAATAWSARSLQDDANREPTASTRGDLRDRADRRLLVGAGLAAAGGALVVAGVLKLAITGSDERPDPVHLVVGPDSIGLRGSF